MQHNEGKRFKIKILAGTILALFLILSGCLRTSTTTEEIDVCPTSIGQNPEAKGGTPKLVVILVKEHPDYREYAYQAFDILLRVLPQVIEPSDRVVMLSMEQSNIDSAIFFDDEVEFVERPPVSEPPIAPPTVGSLPPPSAKPQGRYMESVATQDAIRYIEGTKVSATKAYFEYECGKVNWNRGNEEEWQKWNANKEAAILKFMNEFSARIEENKAQGFHTSISQVFEALQIASLILNTECSKYAVCDFVIFSDFYDYRNFQPLQTDIIFPNIEIAPMLLDCAFVYQCQDKITFWSETFKTFGASDSSQFAINREVEKALLSYFGR
jgi:hypothetical protein